MRKKLTFFTDNPFFGGGNKYFVDLMNGAAAGHEIEVFTNRNGFFEGDRKRLSATAVVKTTRIFKIDRLRSKLLKRKWLAPFNKLVDLTLPLLLLLNVIQFVFLLRKSRPALVFSSNGGYPAAESALSMVIAARINRIPTILSIASMPAKRRKLLWLYDFLLDKAISRASSRVIVNSKAQLSALCSLRGFPPDKIVCIYNGIPDACINGEKRTVRGDNEVVNFGYVGRLEKMKGVDYLIHAIAESSHQKTKFIIVGEGPELGSLVQLATDLGVTGKVVFKGFVNDPVTVIHSEFDVFLFPSLWEGLPYSILEAMRSGLPIISTNVGGIPEVITHGENGLLVKAADPGELAGAIDRLVEDRLLIPRFSMNTRKKFKSEFSLETLENKVQQLILETLK
jgi:glycosyltransferase involved in cell wall biosynthesis